MFLNYHLFASYVRNFQTWTIKDDSSVLVEGLNVSAPAEHGIRDCVDVQTKDIYFRPIPGLCQTKSRQSFSQGLLSPVLTVSKRVVDVASMSLYGIFGVCSVVASQCPKTITRRKNVFSLSTMGLQCSPIDRPPLAVLIDNLRSESLEGLDSTETARSRTLLSSSYVMYTFTCPRLH